MEMIWIPRVPQNNGDESKPQNLLGDSCHMHVFSINSHKSLPQNGGFLSHGGTPFIIHPFDLIFGFSINHPFWGSPMTKLVLSPGASTRPRELSFAGDLPTTWWPRGSSPTLRSAWTDLDLRSKGQSCGPWTFFWTGNWPAQDGDMLLEFIRRWHLASFRYIAIFGMRHAFLVLLAMDIRWWTLAVSDVHYSVCYIWMNRSYIITTAYSCLFLVFLLALLILAEEMDRQNSNTSNFSNF